ncbi:preprotein translocase subunit YajC [Kribbella speibonae]|uniref:Preprotein translocase subunit YajC n=1 Tax=Kribbella speibonae TaxID=1572660 RepID=A0A4R0IGT0_9ACTN|nr:preprotein translocase subunit YajC [Kribbella speibonae]TCC22985.1 preprotein translocase subunit YajC [Kribbella speibonae]TCC30148.1 preprotein translocase subunit YajC [Kribbella speibonae]
MQLLAVPMASSGGGGITLLLPLILIVGMIWFMSRSQRKQRERQAQTVAALVPGTKVITTSGLVGIVEETDDEYVTLEISEGVLVQVVKAAIGRVIPEEDASADEAESAESTEVTETAEATTATASADETADAGKADDDAAKVDVPDAGKAGDKADGKVQDTPKLPPTHTEN